RTIRGILQHPLGELIIVDTPGLHRPRTLLGQRLNDRVQETLGEVDVIAMCFPANEPIGPGDKFINEQLSQYPRAKKVAIVTKTDSTSKANIAEKLMAVSELREWECIVPVSALTAEQLDVLVVQLLQLMPISQRMYPSDMNTEESNEDRIAEIIREAALELMDDELPHSIAVGIDEIIMGALETDPESKTEGEADAVAPTKPRIFASIYVERDSQKGIIIGKAGSRLSQITNTSRRQIERLLGTRVKLNIQVRIAQDWQRDPKQLNKLGF
ncbi:MAG: GTPase Era, partial [Microbacteriaceae bacterium]